MWFMFCTLQIVFVTLPYKSLGGQIKIQSTITVLHYYCLQGLREYGNISHHKPSSDDTVGGNELGFTPAPLCAI